VARDDASRVDLDLLAAHPESSDSVRALQRLAGNTAVTGLLDGRDAHHVDPASAPVPTLQRKASPSAGTEVVRTSTQVTQLVADILSVIEQMEVGTGGAVTESNYHTSSGIRASYASRMQATIPWTIDLLKRHAELRTKFGVTMAELQSAEKCVAAVSAVWKAVMALPAGTTLENAKKNPTVAAKLPNAGLDDDDLGRMLAFGSWRGQVIAGLPDRAEHIAALKELSAADLAAQASSAELAAALKPANKRALAQWRKAKKKGKPPAATVADLTGPERHKLEVAIGTRQVVEPLRQAGVDAGIDIDAGSAGRYIAREMQHQDNSRVSAHWGEDLAAWRRFGVEKSLPEIGEKIKKASVDDEGMTLGHVSIADAVAAIPRAHKTWDDDKVAWQAFKQQNGDAKYADNAVAIFKRTHVYPAAKTPAP